MGSVINLREASLKESVDKSVIWQIGPSMNYLIGELDFGELAFKEMVFGEITIQGISPSEGSFFGRGHIDTLSDHQKVRYGNVSADSKTNILTSYPFQLTT